MADVVLMGELMDFEEMQLVYKELEHLAYHDELYADPNYWEWLALMAVEDMKFVDEEAAYQEELYADPNSWESLEVVNI